MLPQLSPEKVDIVVERYGTLRGLWEVFKEVERMERTMLSREEEPELGAPNKKGRGGSKKSRGESRGYA